MLIECATCGAPLHIVGNEALVTCNYCKRQSRVQSTRTIAAQTPRDWQPPSTWTPPRHMPAESVPLEYQAQVHARRTGTMIGVGIFVLSMLAIVVFGLVEPGGEASSLGKESGPESGEVTPLGEDMQWQSYGFPPIPAQLDGDGIEDVIGFHTIVKDRQSIMHLGAFSGKDLTRIWKSRELGTLKDQLRVMLSGRWVAVSDSNNQLQVLDAATGSIKHALQLSDKAERICADPKQAGVVWVQQVDEQHQLVDMNTGSKERSPRPAWCPKDIELIGNSDCWRGDYRRQNQALSGCSESSKFPRSNGFRAAYVMVAGPVFVGIGTKHPGTAIPMAAGYSPDRRRVLWTRPLAAPGQAPRSVAPELADLLGTRAVFMYEVQDGARLASFDATTGKSLWDVAVPRSEHGAQARTFRVTPSRVYLPHGWLDIIDTNTGAHLGTVGEW